MKKDIIIGAGVLILLSGAVFFLLTNKNFSEKKPAGTQSEAIVLPEDKYTENTEYYQISTNYPSQIDYLATSTGQIIDKNWDAISSIKKFVGETIAQFKKDGDFANITPKTAKEMGFTDGRKQTLQITYLIAQSSRTVSYIFTTYMDTFGAHGNTFFKTFSFDKNTGSELALADVFLADTPYLDMLSDISRAKLPKIIGESADESFIKDGTTPEAKNFANFFFDNKDFVILFEPYAVAPYVFGPQTLHIPLSELKSILKPEYR